jgi:hypothetical protein
VAAGLLPMDVAQLISGGDCKLCMEQRLLDVLRGFIDRCRKEARCARIPVDRFLSRRRASSADRISGKCHG